MYIIIIYDQILFLLFYTDVNLDGKNNIDDMNVSFSREHDG